MTFTLRPARPADLDALLALAAASPEAPRWQPSDYAPYLAPDPAPPLLRIALVAEAPPHLLGFAAATLLLTTATDASTSAPPENRCELDSLAVHPTARRQGIGAALGQQILSWAAAHGARHLALELRAGNAPALRLYQRLGLRQEGRRPLYYADPPEDALLLGMPVTGVSSAG